MVGLHTIIDGFLDEQRNQETGRAVPIPRTAPEPELALGSGGIPPRSTRPPTTGGDDRDNNDEGNDKTPIATDPNLIRDGDRILGDILPKHLEGDTSIVGDDHGFYIGSPSGHPPISVLSEFELRRDIFRDGLAVVLGVNAGENGIPHNREMLNEAYTRLLQSLTKASTNYRFADLGLLLYDKGNEGLSDMAGVIYAAMSERQHGYHNDIGFRALGQKRKPSQEAYKLWFDRHGAQNRVPFTGGRPGYFMVYSEQTFSAFMNLDLERAINMGWGETAIPISVAAQAYGVEDEAFRGAAQKADIRTDYQGKEAIPLHDLTHSGRYISNLVQETSKLPTRAQYKG